CPPDVLRESRLRSARGSRDDRRIEPLPALARDPALLRRGISDLRLRRNRRRLERNRPLQTLLRRLHQERAFVRNHRQTDRSRTLPVPHPPPPHRPENNPTLRLARQAPPPAAASIEDLSRNRVTNAARKLASIVPS